MKANRKAYLAIAVLFFIVYFAYVGLRALEAHWYEGFLPETITTERTLFVGGSSGLLEGCGVAIYKIDPSTLNNIRTNGIVALKQARKSKRHEREYVNWSETPYIEPTERLRNPWLGGMNESCTVIPSELIDGINRALHSPGSFYTTTHESGVIVIPSTGLVVLSHNG